MASIGYGDIHPVTILEKQVIIFLGIVTTGVFAYALNSIGSIFREIELRKATIKNQKFQITQYMNQRNITIDTQVNVIKALEYLNIQEQNGFSRGVQVLQSLPKQFQNSIYKEYYCKILKNSRIIKNGQFSQNLVEELALKMKELECSSNTIIYKQGQSSDRLYFLVEGSLEIISEPLNVQNSFKIDLSKKSNQADQSLTRNNTIPSKVFKERKNLTQKEQNTSKIIKILSGNCELDNKYFYSQNVHDFTIRSQGVSRLVYFERHSMLQIAKQIPSDYEKFCQIKDQMLYDKTEQLQTCYICNSVLHSQTNCPYVHLKISKYHLMGKYFYPIFQPRQKNVQIQNYSFNTDYLRLKKPKLKALVDLPNYRDALKKIRHDIVYENGIVLEDQFSAYQDDRDFFYMMPKIEFFHVDKEDMFQTKQKTFLIEENGEEDIQHFREDELKQIEEEEALCEELEQDLFLDNDKTSSDTSSSSNLKTNQKSINKYSKSSYESLSIPESSNASQQFHQQMQNHLVKKQKSLGNINNSQKQQIQQNGGNLKNSNNNFYKIRKNNKNNTQNNQNQNKSLNFELDESQKISQCDTHSNDFIKFQIDSNYNKQGSIILNQSFNEKSNNFPKMQNLHKNESEELKKVGKNLRNQISLQSLKYDTDSYNNLNNQMNESNTQSPLKILFKQSMQNQKKTEQNLQQILQFLASFQINQNKSTMSRKNSKYQLNTNSKSIHFQKSESMQQTNSNTLLQFQQQNTLNSKVLYNTPQKSSISQNQKSVQQTANIHKSSYEPVQSNQYQLELDKIKIYEWYYKRYNYNIILNKYNKIRQKKINEINQQKAQNFSSYEQLGQYQANSILKKNKKNKVVSQYRGQGSILRQPNTPKVNNNMKSITNSKRKSLYTSNQ